MRVPLEHSGRGVPGDRHDGMVAVPRPNHPAEGRVANRVEAHIAGRDAGPLQGPLDVLPHRRERPLRFRVGEHPRVVPGQGPEQDGDARRGEAVEGGASGEMA
jgi:hypothetical protein